MIGNTMVWTAPTEYANGDPLLANAIVGYHIYMGDTFDVEDGIALTVGPSPTSVAFSSIPGAAVGKWFAVSAFTEVGESALTGSQEWEGTGSPPTTPVGLSTLFFVTA